LDTWYSGIGERALRTGKNDDRLIRLTERKEEFKTCGQNEHYREKFKGKRKITTACGVGGYLARVGGCYLGKKNVKTKRKKGGMGLRRNCWQSPWEEGGTVLQKQCRTFDVPDLGKHLEMSRARRVFGSSTRIIEDISLGPGIVKNRRLPEKSGRVEGSGRGGKNAVSKENQWMTTIKKRGDSEALRALLHVEIYRRKRGGWCKEKKG